MGSAYTIVLARSLTTVSLGGAGTARRVIRLRTEAKFFRDPPSSWFRFFGCRRPLLRGLPNAPLRLSTFLDWPPIFLHRSPSLLSRHPLRLSSLRDGRLTLSSSFLGWFTWWPAFLLGSASWLPAFLWRLQDVENSPCLSVSWVQIWRCTIHNSIQPINQSSPAVDTSGHVYCVTMGGFGLMTRFIAHYGKARDYTLQFAITHTHTLVPTDVFTSHCSIATSNGGRSPFLYVPELSSVYATSF
jgi:hypothetical protein